MGYYRRRANYKRRHKGERSSSESGMSVFIGLFLTLASFGIIKGIIGNPVPSILLLMFILVCFLLYKRSKNKRESDRLARKEFTPEEIASRNIDKHNSRFTTDVLNGGEQEVANTLSWSLDYKEYFLMHNLTIPSSYNGSSQIDHLVISRFGIFVIETKDYQGWIFGTDNHAKWTQSLPGGNNKFQFENPIRQNWSHIQSLKELFPTIPEAEFKSVVVFTGSSEFKTPMPDYVLNIDALVNYIKRYTEPKLSEDIVQAVIGKLTLLRQTNDITLGNHIENIQNHHK